MSLCVCLLLDDEADGAVRRLWQRLEAAGVPTLQSHTHGRHRPHLTLASLRTYELDAVRSALARQEATVAAVLGTGADLHPHYRPGEWLPHLSLAPRLPLEQLTTVAREVYGVLPLTATLDRAALVDTATGDVHELPHLV